MMRRLLVTGGAGFIGSNFIRFWIERHPEDRLVMLDALTYAGNLENLASVVDHASYRFVRGDIRDLPLVVQLFAEENINIVAHFAAESHVDRSILGPQAFIETNIQGTFTLLEAARGSWGDNLGEKRFIHISTDEVYGSLGFDEPAFTEESRYRPNSPYAASKAASDHLTHAYHHTYGIPAIITHCSNNYGPYQFPEKLIPLMIVNALKGKLLPVYGEGRNIRDWIYVDDHCRALESILDRGAAGEIYNIGGNSEKRNIDVVTAICDIIDERLGLRDNKTRDLITFVADRPGHDLRYAINTAKISQELGWTPQESFDTGLRKTIDWYLGNKDWWQRVRSGAYKTYYQAQYGQRLAEYLLTNRT
jgi:dTDP-glucose 4,6-dehydratase